MPAEIIDKLYEIAQKGGYAGDQPARWEGGIAAITSAISNETPVLRDTVVDALDDLKTVAFEGGGGGGGDLGALQYTPVFVDTAPVVSNTASFDDSRSFERFKVGDTVVIDNLNGTVAQVAAGITSVAFLATEAGLQVDAYVCTVEFDGDDNFVYTTVSPWTGTVTEGQDEGGVTPWSLVIPELQNGASLFLYPHT